MKRSFIFSINKAFCGFLLGVFLLLGVIRASAQITVTATAGTLGPTVYGTLGAAFTAINAGTHNGVITISVTGSTIEPVAAVLNDGGGSAGLCSYTALTIKPAIAVTATITGNIAGNGTIQLNGASNITIDGSNTAGGSTQNLTIGNSFTGGGCTAIRMNSTSTTVGSSNNTIKNCKIIGSAAATPNSGNGIIAGSGTALYGHAEASNSGNTILNCAFSGTQGGVLANGPEPTLVPGALVDANWTIKGNTFNNIYFNSIIVFSSSNATIADNVITNCTVNGNGPVNAIELSWTINGCTISGNKIHNMSNTNTTILVGFPPPSTEGIYCDVPNTGANVNIFNNFIDNIFSFGLGAANIALTAHAIYIDQGGGYNIYHNTIDMAADPTGGTGIFSCICFNTTISGTGIPAGGVNLEDNIIMNAQTFGSRYGVYCAYPATIFATMDYNDYVASSVGSFMGNIGGCR